MKITKVNTTAGQFRLPVSTELSSVIERMQEPRTKEVADRIASIAMQSRLMMEQGMPRYFIRDTDLRWPTIATKPVSRKRAASSGHPGTHASSRWVLT